MSDNVNIIVQDTINEIVVNTAVVVETIDINVQVAVDEVNIIANPNNYLVNINRIIGEQVQSDWDQNDDQEPDYIKNKPSIPSIAGLATVVYVDQQDNLKVDKVLGKGLSENDFTNTLKTKLDGIESGAQVNVNADWNATTGDAEILNKPTIPAAQVNSDWNATSGVAEILNKPSIPTLTSDLINDGEDGVNPFITAADLPTTVTSVGLTMPSAFNVANSPITSAGTLAVTGAGVVSQYVRGDGSLANFPTSTGGGASVSYYLNGSVSQGTIGGVAYKEINGVPVIGTGTDFTINADGYIAQFITDVGDPNKLLIPAGNWNFETYFSASSNGGTPRFYIELYKYDGATFTLIATNSATPEYITGGTSIDLYFTALAIPQTTLLATDRLAVRFYVIHSGRTITMHTENSHLSQIITTFSTGLTALNGLTTQVQSFATGTSGTDFGISSATSTHTFNLPTASATNRGALSTTDWSTFNGKFNLPSLTSGSVLFSNGTTIAQDNANLFWDDTNNRLNIGGITSNTSRLGIKAPGALSTDIALRVRNSADSGDLMTVNGLGGLNVTTSASGSDRPISVSGSTGEVFYIRGFGDAIFSGNVWLGVVNGTSRIGPGSMIITSSQGTGTAFTTFTHNNNNVAFKIISNSVIQLNPIAGNVLVGTTTDNGGKLQIKAPGALSTDIALRVRNSADTADLMTVNGVGAANILNNLYVGNSNTSYSGYNSIIIGGSATNAVLDFVSNGTRIGEFYTSSNSFNFFTDTGKNLNFYVNNNLAIPAITIGTNSNVGINVITPNSSAQLDITSTTKGFLPPRMTNAQRIAIATPAIGLMVYCTDTIEGLYINKSTGWTFII
jgi:hypothetical protein